MKRRWTRADLEVLNDQGWKNYEAERLHGERVRAERDRLRAKVHALESRELARQPAELELALGA